MAAILTFATNLLDMTTGWIYLPSKVVGTPTGTGQFDFSNPDDSGLLVLWGARI